MSDQNSRADLKNRRAALDLSNIEKQIAKAKKVISGQLPATKTKFLNMDTQSKQLNYELIDKGDQRLRNQY